MLITNDGFSTERMELPHRAPSKKRQKVVPLSKYCSISS